LDRQNISFAPLKGGGPELLGYELGELLDLYTRTLETITDEKQGFVGARYQATAYIQGDNRDKFIKTFKGQLEDVSDLWIAQANLAKFMRRLLVMRFESSKAAFKSTLNKMIESNERIENWWDNLNAVPIMKKGKLPDPPVKFISPQIFPFLSISTLTSLLEVILKPSVAEAPLGTIPKFNCSPSYIPTPNLFLTSTNMGNSLI